MVGHMPLEHGILVRIQVPQVYLEKKKDRLRVAGVRAGEHFRASGAWYLGSNPGPAATIC